MPSRRQPVARMQIFFPGMISIHRPIVMLNQSSLNRCRDHMYRDELPRGRVGARGAWGVPLTPAGRGKW